MNLLTIKSINLTINRFLAAAPKAGGAFAGGKLGGGVSSTSNKYFLKN